MEESTLWRAVIIQALHDASKSLKPSSPREDHRAQYHARRWLTLDQGDFVRCCLMADLEPSFVRGWALDRAAEGWTKRRPEGGCTKRQMLVQEGSKQLHAA